MNPLSNLTLGVWMTFFFSVVTWAQELPQDYRLELDKVGDLASRTQAEEAVRIILYEGATPRVHAAYAAILNSRQEDLVLFMFKKKHISLGMTESWASQNLRLLTKGILHVFEDPYSMRTADSAVGAMTQRMLEILQNEGIQVDIGHEYYTNPRSAECLDWLQKWLLRGREVAVPGSEFSQMVNDSLRIVIEYRKSYERRMASAKPTLPGNTGSENSPAITPDGTAFRTASGPETASSSPSESYSAIERWPWHFGAGAVLLVLIILWVKRQ